MKHRHLRHELSNHLTTFLFFWYGVDTLIRMIKSSKWLFCLWYVLLKITFSVIVRTKKTSSSFSVPCFTWFRFKPRQNFYSKHVNTFNMHISLNRLDIHLYFCASVVFFKTHQYLIIAIKSLTIKINCVAEHQLVQKCRNIPE